MTGFVALNTAVLNEQIADVMLGQPGITQKDLAAHFNRSESWIGQVTRSATFREILATKQRRLNEALLDNNLAELADLAVGRLIKDLKDPACLLPHAEIRETTDMVLSRLGYGQKSSQGQTQGGTNVAVVIGSDLLDESRERMKQAQVINQ